MIEQKYHIVRFHLIELYIKNLPHCDCRQIQLRACQLNIDALAAVPVDNYPVSPPRHTSGAKPTLRIK